MGALKSGFVVGDGGGLDDFSYGFLANLFSGAFDAEWYGAVADAGGPEHSTVPEVAGGSDGHTESDNDVENRITGRAYLDAEQSDIDRQIGVPENTPEIDPGNESHIFRTDKGHVPDTATNRALIRKAAALGQVVKALQGGAVRRALVLPNGVEVWADVRNNIINNGGMNLLLPKYPLLH